MADLRDQLQQALAGRYTLERELGRGGMSTVFLATDLNNNGRVALKVLHPDLAAAVGAQRFLREIQIAALLDHDHILALLDSGLADNLPWYSMPVVDGESLRNRLDRVGLQLSFADVIGIGRQVAQALDYAHALGIVHRDIKPENILLLGDRAWLADFGIARFELTDATPITSKSSLVGTPLYMSPEQARLGGGSVDGRSDVYSLGCVLYEMLGGEPPFNAATREAILNRHALDPVPPLGTLRRTVGPATEAVMRIVLAKSAADRYSTATEAVAALEAALKQPPKPRARRFLVAGAVAVATVLGAFVLLRPAEALDPHRVIVLPMDVRGGGSISGDDAATALVNALNTTDSLIAVVADPGAPGANASWPESLTTRLGRDRHARYLVSGHLATGDPLRVDIEVRDLAEGSVLLREVTAPAVSDAFAIARRVARAILPDLIRPGVAIVDEGLLSSDVPALAAYLEGERAYREGAFARADSLFGRAVARDSAFAWAALRGAQAASWLTERARAGEFLRVALQKVDSFPPRYAALGRGLGAYGIGKADSAVTYLHEALALDHRWAEAHMALGEVLHHYIPQVAYPFDVANAEFDSALLYDPGFTAPLFHAVQHAVWRGNRARADSLYRRFAAVATDLAQREQLALMLGCLDGTTTPERWKEAADRSVAVAAQAATWLVVGGLSRLACAKNGIEAIVTKADVDWVWYYHATVQLAFINAVLGDSVAVRRLLGELGESADVVTILLATSGVPIGDLADSALHRLSELPDSEATPRRLWGAGTWLIERRDSATALTILNRLAQLDTGSAPRLAHLLRASLQARLTLLRGDTAGAIFALRTLHPTGDQAVLRWDPWEALPWERFELAQLLAKRGRLKDAAEVASAFDSPASFGFVPWLPASLLLRERLERGLGDAPYANELRERYRRFTRSDSQPQFSTRR